MPRDTLAAIERVLTCNNAAVAMIALDTLAANAALVANVLVLVAKSAA